MLFAHGLFRATYKYLIFLFTFSATQIEFSVIQTAKPEAHEKSQLEKVEPMNCDTRQAPN